MTKRRPTEPVDELLRPPRKRRSDYQGPRDWQEVARKHGKPFTYRLPPELGKTVKEKAKEEGCKVSEFVAWALSHVLEELRTGKVRASCKHSVSPE